MITKFFLKRYDFKVLAYKSLQVFILFLLTIILFLGLFTYDEFDPSPFSVGDEKPNNLLGAFGANFSSILFFIFGDASWLMIAGFLMLIRIVIITNYKRSHVFLRFIIIFFASFILSLSFELFSLNSGIFGKALLSKIKNFTLEYTSENIYSYIMTINFIFFIFIFLINISKNINSFF